MSLDTSGERRITYSRFCSSFRPSLAARLAVALAQAAAPLARVHVAARGAQPALAVHRVLSPLPSILRPVAEVVLSFAVQLARAVLALVRLVGRLEGAAAVAHCVDRMPLRKPVELPVTAYVAPAAADFAGYVTAAERVKIVRGGKRATAADLKASLAAAAALDTKLVEEGEAE